MSCLSKATAGSIVYISLFGYLFSGITNPYVTMALCIVRYSAISNVNRSKSMFSFKHMKLILIVAVSVAVAVFIPELVVYKVSYNSTTSCYFPTADYSVMSHKTYSWYVVARLAVPYVTLTSLSVYIIYVMCKAKSQANALQNRRQSQSVNLALRKIAI